MEYTVNQLGKMAGVSARTLRYYDEIGLLKPGRLSASGYRIYGQREVDLLQQILFYRTLGVGLEEIRRMITAPDFDRTKALRAHLDTLLARQQQLNLLVANVQKTIQAAKGETTMTNEEKFEGLKQGLLDENERQYGAELRERYGEATVESANARIKGMTEPEYAALQQLSARVNETLKAALKTGDPAGTLAQEACDLHRQWLGYYSTSYSRCYHLALAQMYVDDPRFTVYYDKLGAGCAKFLRDALVVYCSDEEQPPE